jgi:hypothetical protein
MVSCVHFSERNWELFSACRSLTLEGTICNVVGNSMDKLAYGTQVAHTAFEPPCSANAIRMALKRRELRTVRIGVKPYILTVDLIEWATKQPEYLR